MDTKIILKKERELYNSLSFICKAIPKKSPNTIYALTLMKIKGNEAIGTDGHRLHIAELENLDLNDGLYQVTKTAKNIVLIKDDSDLRYPNYGQVMPDSEGRECFYFSHDKKTLEFSLSKLLGQLFNIGSLLNYKFIEDLCEVDSWTAWYSDKPLSPVLFTNCNHKAVIMPMRQD